ncbi:hypothetical protein [Paenibacillus sp. MBLB4367]|uniref:hypothetical protein n=1 Tax=Paenibacillus sp. MBLB4367 TaxID=3384767 RepID=UPI0039081151
MKQYATPQLVEYGASKSLIKGNCNWGNENFALDKSGYWQYDWYYCYFKNMCHVTTLCVPLGGGNNDECSVDSDCK